MVATLYNVKIDTKIDLCIYETVKARVQMFSIYLIPFINKLRPIHCEYRPFMFYVSYDKSLCCQLILKEQYT